MLDRNRITEVVIDKPRHADGSRDSAISTLYNAHIETVYGFCRARLPQHDAEDVTAEVFRAAAERLSADSAARLDASWLITAARNRIIDRWRRETRWQRRRPLIESAALVTERDHSERFADAELVTAALDKLSTDHRAVLILRYLDDLAVSEIATLLGRRVPAVESLLTRARRALTAVLEIGDVDD